MKNKKKTYLNKTFKQKWLEALRSGNYAQTTGMLCQQNFNNDKNGYCCLGVACRVIIKNKLLPDFKADRNGEFYYKNEWLNNNELLEEVLNAIGMTQNQQITLINMNDRDEKSFKEIADHIEKKL